MESTELYRQLLGIEVPWTVQRVEMDVAGLSVDVHLAHVSGVRFACPRCNESCPVYDHLAERRWRHLDSCQFRTVLHARTPRVRCPTDGVVQVTLPWAQPGGRFTSMFEALAIKVLLATDVKNAAGILGITWDEAWHIMERAVTRGRQAKGLQAPEFMGVDEKSYAKRHKYVTLVYDLQAATVEYVGQGRSYGSLAAYFQAFDPPALAGIEGIALDMCQAYVNACNRFVPQADQKMVFDRFHIMKKMLEAVDSIRKQESRELLRQGDDTLAKSKHLWLYSRENLPAKLADRFKQLRHAQLRTAKAWAIKESLRDLWAYTCPDRAKAFWSRWYFWATHCQLPEVVKVAKMIASRLDNVLSYFTHRLTNATSEGLNSKISTVQKRAYGFRNIDNFKIAVYFHCGGLSLYPDQVTHRKV